MNSKEIGDIPVMWKPNQRYGGIMRKFKKILEKKYDIKTDDYWELHKWSIEHLSEFWAEIWDFSGIICSKKFDKVIDLSIPPEESPEWFQGARLNLAENFLKHRDEKIAILVPDEGKESEKLTYAQLFEESKLYAAAFRKFGLKKGEVVACQMTNRKEAIIAMIAVVSIGAIWASVLPLMGSEATFNRIQQVEPKIFLTIDRIPHDGKHIDMMEKIKEVSEGLPSLKKVVIVPAKEDSQAKDISTIKNSCFLDEFLQLGRADNGTVQPMVFEQVSCSHPVYILFTSGTTGPPKAIVHGAGILLALYRDLAIHMDSGEDSVWFTQSPVGWASWCNFTSPLFLGAKLVLFEDLPFFVNPKHYWNLVDKYGATHLFIPAAPLDEIRKKNYVPTKENRLETLKVIISAGSVVKPNSYDFVYEKVKKDVMFSSFYACTETLGSGFLPDTTLPIYRGESPAISLGCKVEILDKHGKPVIGKIGETFISNPMPNLALGLWNDKDNFKFRQHYFSKYPGKFSLNDYGMINPLTKGVFIDCRSDETLKNGQYRIGSAEIYKIVDLYPEVSDSLCVSQFNKNLDERVVLFLKMKEGYSFTDELTRRIRERIQRALTIYHVPSVILETKDIPYNMNGKKLEILVKKIINNKDYNVETVINPESLKHFHNIPELQVF